MDLPLPPDFKEFLQLLNSERTEYLLVGGYAVGYHGYPRPTGDLDIWVAIHPDTATKLVEVLRKFGFGNAGATAELFRTPGKVVRMGEPPVRIEVLTSISGVAFETSYARRVQAVLDGVPVNIISRDDLLSNKRGGACEGSERSGAPGSGVEVVFVWSDMMPVSAPTPLEANGVGGTARLGATGRGTLPSPGEDLA